MKQDTLNMIVISQELVYAWDIKVKTLAPVCINEQTLIDSVSSCVDSVWLSWRCECTLLAALSICHHLQLRDEPTVRPSDRGAPVFSSVIPLLACAGTSTAPKNTHLMETNPLIPRRVSVTKAFRAVSFRATLCQVWPSSPENRQTKRNLKCKRPKSNFCAEVEHIHKDRCWL